MTQARLIFEDGTIFKGKIFASTGDRYGEVVFNTAMSGYQEVLTDPSYAGQMVIMTYPLIGSYGINPEDMESRGIFLNALLIREYIDFPSNWRSKKTLKTYLEENNILGIEDLDTRAITRYIRNKGAQKALITTSSDPIETLIQKIKESPSMEGRNLAEEVTTPTPYIYKECLEKSLYKIAVIDCGVKYNILRLLNKYGCECHVFPTTITADEILSQNFDGVFISNGPGDPEPVTTVSDTVKALIGKLPIFGICLGHQLIGIALGGSTYKLKFGHHGANHPVKHLKTSHIEVTSQNHGFCIDMDSLDKNKIEITHINLNDNTVEGFRHKELPVFCVQYHPEAAPGPHDSEYLFEDYIALLKKEKNK